VPLRNRLHNRIESRRAVDISDFDLQSVAKLFDVFDVFAGESSIGAALMEGRDVEMRDRNPHNAYGLDGRQIICCIAFVFGKTRKRKRQ
jgi:ribosomal silencing factor RsfS